MFGFSIIIKARLEIKPWEGMSMPRHLGEAPGLSGSLPQVFEVL